MAPIVSYGHPKGHMRRALLLTAGVAAMLLLTVGARAGGGTAPTCRGETATIWGTSGDDVLVGTSGDDVIVGKGGADEIRGRGGNDLICGDGGDDVLVGGAGDDTLDGATGDDTLQGGTGDDVLRGGVGDDVLRGGGGHDLLSGSGGRDALMGGNADDVLRGGDGPDDLRGGRGPDLLKGGSGVDECRSGSHQHCEIVALRKGDRGTAVRYLQRTLRDHKLYRGAIDGVFDRQVAIAVATFHKATGPAYANPARAVEQWQAHPPSEKMALSDWSDLLAFDPEPPKSRRRQPDRVEVDIGHQVLYLILDGEVDAIVHVSTGYHADDTPRTTGLPDGGYFWYKHPYNGWSPRPGLWSIYKFWAYRAGADFNYGVHGYRDVPYWPASHGCIRVHVWAADYLSERFFLGMPVHVWDE
jgi:hypothetical protein